MSKFFLSLAIAALGLAVGTSDVRAQTTNCTGSLAKGTYGTVLVSVGQTCRVSALGTTVLHNIVVAQGANLKVECTSTDPTASCLVVSGNLHAANAANIEINADAGAVKIDGNVSLSGTTGNLVIAYVEVGGNVIITSSTTNIRIDLAFNDINGNLIFNNNKASQNLILQNFIESNLICNSNSPPPNNLGSFPNTVAGKEIGQCAGL
jgi:hypothetical protein